MNNVVSVGKLCDTQNSKLRNGHSIKIKKDTGNQLNLTNEQLKKIEAAGKKGRAYTVTLIPEQAEKHGQGIFGDIATKMKKLDIINHVISSIKPGASKGVAKLAKAAQDKIDSNVPTIEGEAVKRLRGMPKKGEGFGALVWPIN